MNPEQWDLDERTSVAHPYQQAFHCNIHLQCSSQEQLNLLVDEIQLIYY